ncbi:MAG: lipopolysaccharide biosynthesis protein [Eubacteriales bacterium]|nr:lipopolysaccharide biosynthesis protein [Eubacteriales bacterium]
MKQQNRVAILNIASTLVLNGIAFFTGPLFLRLLGPTNNGIVNIYNVWVSVIAVAFTLQTQGTLVNARLEYPEEDQKRYQSSVLSLSVVSYALCAGVVLAFIGPISGLLRLPWYVVVLMLLHGFGTFCINFLSTKFIYEFKAGWKMLLALAVAVLNLALSLSLVLALPYESRFLGRIGGVSATYILLGLPVCIYVLAKGRTLFHRGYWKFCLFLSVPMVFQNLSDLILGQSDRVMLQQMMGETLVGQYGAALTFGGIMFTIFGALNHTWVPFFFEDMKLGRREALESRTKNFLELFTVLSVGFVLLAAEVYRLYASEAYLPGTGLIPVFVTNYFLNFLCTFPINFEYFKKNTKVVAVVTVISSLVNLALNYVLIRSLGMYGAALATAASHVLQLTMHHGYARLVLGKGDYPFAMRLWSPYLMCYLAAVALAYLTPGAWYIRWPLGAIIGVWELWRIKKRKVLI